MSFEITIKQELRPCYAYGRKALFHKWYGSTSEEAIVEYEDGSVGQVNVENVKFLDGRFQEYCFEDGR